MRAASSHLHVQLRRPNPSSIGAASLQGCRFALTSLEGLACVTILPAGVLALGQLLLQMRGLA